MWNNYYADVNALSSLSLPLFLSSPSTSPLSSPLSWVLHTLLCYNQPRVYVLCTANDPGPPHVPPSPHRPFRRMARLLSRPLRPGARCKTVPLWKLHRNLRRQHGHGHGVRPPHPLGPRAPPCYGERATHRTQSLNTALERFILCVRPCTLHLTY